MSDDLTTATLRDQVTASGYECFVRRDEVVVRTCVYCGNDRGNLELSAVLGVFHCWACNAGGRLDQFLTQFVGGSHHIPVRAKRQVVSEKGSTASEFATQAISAESVAGKYLGRRGISPLTAKEFGLMVCTQQGHPLEGRIVIPLRDYWTAEIVGHVGRSFTGRWPKYRTTLPRRRITGYRMMNRRGPCVLVEGPFDGISASRAGFSTGILSGTTSGELDFFAARLPEETEIVVLLDGEAEDQARRLAARLRAFRPRVWIAALPAKSDPADYAPAVLRRFINHSREEQNSPHH